MLVELEAKSQVTIPKDIVKDLNLNQGDQFEITVVDVAILLTPVAVYSQKVIQELKETVETMKEQTEKGEVPVFDDVEALFEELEK